MAVSFRDGKKWVDGRAYEPLAMKETKSRTNPTRKPYQTVFWADGTASCNCTGWATHKHCLHTDDLLHEVETGFLGPALRDILRVARLERRVEREVARATTKKRAPAQYTVSPTVAPANAPASLDGDKIVYRRIHLD